MLPDSSRFIARLLVIASIAALLGPSGVGVAADEPEITEDPYPLRDCIILNCPLGDNADFVFYGDREIRVCCQNCVSQFGDSEDTWVGMIDEKIVEVQTPFYPLKTCVVDGEKLDEYNTVDFVFNNRLFRLCSDDCCVAIEKTPAKYFALLNKAVIKTQKNKYPLDTCVVSGKPLGDSAIDHVVGNQLIRLADEDQREVFNENPGKYLQTLREAAKKK